MLDITWGVVGLSCGIVGSMVYSWVEQKKRKAGARPEEISYETQTAILKSADHNTTPKLRVGVIEAINGRILEVATAAQIHGHNHYEWKTEMYVVPEDQKLSEAIAVVMLMKGLEK